jgi:hypothetical protein
MAERHDPHAGESMVGPHGAADDHGDTHGHDDHAHGADAHGADELGPVNVQAWVALLLGVALGLVALLAFVQALS